MTAANHDFQACINLAPKEFPLLVTPDRNPQKGLRSKLEVVHGYLRLKKQIGPTAQLEFYPGFLLREGPNPTVSWILRVKARRPDLRIHLLMGHDSFASLPSWIQAQDLIKLVQGLWVVPRGEGEAERLVAQNWVAAHQGPRVQYLAHHPHERVSSTRLRQK
jgi:nicotinic acid mononucleotide adenylyltransferase